MKCIMTVMVTRMHFISIGLKTIRKRNENLNTVPIMEKVSHQNCKQYILYIFYCPVGEHEHAH